MYEKIALISPYVEVELRKLYWKNVKFLSRFRPKRAILSGDKVNWIEVESYLKKNGVAKGSLMVLHSSYNALKSTGYSPMEITSHLRDMLGSEGTLAMPVIRKYEEEPEVENCLRCDYSKLVCTYDTRDSRIVTGALPKSMIQEEDVVISRHPLNTLAAVGKFAQPMMKNNIVDDYSTSCGTGSSWAFCVDHDAMVVGLGIYLSHSLTIRLVSEDLYMEEWPIKNWYWKRTFDVIDGTFKKRIHVLERDYKWGIFYLAELNMRRDLIRNNILKTKNVGGLLIELLSAKELVEYVRTQENKSYPYYIPVKYHKN